MGCNPAHRSKIPILVRIRLREGGYTAFEWYLWRRHGALGFWRLWRSYIAKDLTLREAIPSYRDYAEYWRTGDW